MPARAGIPLVRTGDITHLSKPKEFDDANQVSNRLEAINVH